MTGLTPQKRRDGVRRTAGAVAIVAGLALAGCTTGNTYGTGKSPAMQTLEDLAGIAALSSAKREPIDYTPRPKIVAPPTVAELPAPGAGNTALLASNWPNDPDQVRAQIRADTAAREASGAPAPALRIPGAGVPKPGEINKMLLNIDPSVEATPTPEEQAGAKKLFADARGVAVDENGNPIRRYLSDPPSEYRLPDPTAPVEIIDKPKAKKKFKWWWQK